MIDDEVTAGPQDRGPASRKVLVLNLGLQVVQDGLCRRMHVVDVDQMVHELPHKLVLGRSRDRNLAGSPCISSTDRWHRLSPPPEWISPLEAR